MSYRSQKSLSSTVRQHSLTTFSSYPLFKDWGRGYCCLLKKNNSSECPGLFSYGSDSFLQMVLASVGGPEEPNFFPQAISFMYYCQEIASTIAIFPKGYFDLPTRGRIVIYCSLK